MLVSLVDARGLVGASMSDWAGVWVGFPARDGFPGSLVFQSKGYSGKTRRSGWGFP